MGVKTSGFSCDESVLRKVDALAKRRGLSRSALVVSVLERELAREKDGALEVVVEGRRYVPVSGS